MPGVDLNYFIRQANKLTEKIEERRTKLAEETVEAQAGEGRVTVVATGGNAPVIVKYCRNKIVYDKYLLMDGLWTIYQKNK